MMIDTGPAGAAAGSQVNCPSGESGIAGTGVIPAIAGASTPAAGRLTGSSLPPAITTVPPIGVTVNNRLANSIGSRTQPWLAGKPGRLPACTATPSQVSL